MKTAIRLEETDRQILYSLHAVRLGTLERAFRFNFTCLVALER